MLIEKMLPVSPKYFLRCDEYWMTSKVALSYLPREMSFSEFLAKDKAWPEK
jgi:hypothetical protein